MDTEVLVGFLSSSILAGVLIGLACVIQGNVADPALGAILFSTGLLAVRMLKADLYTGKAAVIFLDNKYSWIILPAMFIFNGIGVLVVYLLPVQSCIDITQFTVYELLQKGALCGALVHIGTREGASQLLTTFCVVSFILAGGLHSIACIHHFLHASITMLGLRCLIAIALGNLLGALIVEVFTRLKK